jgi:type IV secretion system protein VirB1
VILPLAIVSQLAASCAPGVAASTLIGIARVESQLDPLAVHDNTTRQSYAPPSKDAAVTLAQSLISAGHSVDSGLMQINSSNLGWLALSIPDAFEPCASLAAGAKVLTSLSRYNSGSPTASIPYAVRVLTAAADPNSPPGRPGNVPPTPGTRSPPASGAKPPDWDVFPDNQPSSHQSSTQTGDYHAQD